MRYNILFSVDTGYPTHNRANKRQDIQKVMTSLGIQYDVVKYHRNAVNQIFFNVSDTDFNNLGAIKLVEQYQAVMYSIDEDNSFIELDLEGDHYDVGKFVTDVPFFTCNVNDREWFVGDDGKYSMIERGK